MSNCKPMVNNDDDKMKVILGKGSVSVFKQHSRVFITKKCTPAIVESLLRVFNANGQEPIARSYTEVTKGRVNSKPSIPDNSKSRVFWAKIVAKVQKTIARHTW